MARDPEPGVIKDRREIEALGVTVVRFSNGVEAWFKPTDFKNDEVMFSLVSPGGSSLAPPDQYFEARCRRRWSSCRARAAIAPSISRS